MEEKKITELFKAFSDENRIRVLRMLQSGERCACELLEELEVSQPTLSHHMKILCEAGVVEARKDGKWMHYTLSAEGTKLALDTLKQLITPRGPRKVKQ